MATGGIGKIKTRLREKKWASERRLQRTPKTVIRIAGSDFFVIERPILYVAVIAGGACR